MLRLYTEIPPAVPCECDLFTRKESLSTRHAYEQWVITQLVIVPWSSIRACTLAHSLLISWLPLAICSLSQKLGPYPGVGMAREPHLRRCCEKERKEHVKHPAPSRPWKLLHPVLPPVRSPHRICECLGLWPSNAPFLVSICLLVKLGSFYLPFYVTQESNEKKIYISTQPYISIHMYMCVCIYCI